jgi:UDP-N-acetylmuramoyl-L-alanyl-D-glutamate--2,6-diaminopimelate ligase
MDQLLRHIKSLLPEHVSNALRGPYHFLLAWLGALWYGNPSKDLMVLGVTGTKGKSSTLEFANAILEEAGYSTALASTIRFKVGNTTDRNYHKMTMPGRFFLQAFLRRAARAGCDVALVEMTSEGAKQYRHRFIALDAFIFTGISPEHIESHGSFERYLAAKRDIGLQLTRSSKPHQVLIANADDEHAGDFLSIHADEQRTFSLQDATPYEVTSSGIFMTLNGEHVTSTLHGEFNIYNILAAAEFAQTLGIDMSCIRAGVSRVTYIPGRTEHIHEGQRFDVVVDYAHTPDSLRRLYETYQARSTICVLGATGGGRDRWKRPEMAAIAERHCDEMILTNEDPYDEDPNDIIEDMRTGLQNNDGVRTNVILDRREAIEEAIRRASVNDQRSADTSKAADAYHGVAVLISGKGTDPYIMGPNGTKTPWSDAAVARESLQSLPDTRV